jgi:hypothetical protein
MKIKTRKGVLMKDFMKAMQDFEAKEITRILPETNISNFTIEWRI